MRKTLDRYVEERLRRGRGYLLKTEAVGELALSSAAFNAAASRLARKGRVAPLRKGFVLILRPEDYVFGAPPVSQWIDPLMRHLGIDYRISLLSAAQFHGSAHQAPQEFQVIVPKQVRRIFMGRQRVRFMYQASHSFKAVNQSPWIGQLKTSAGYAKVAGIELLLLDLVRYFRQAAGLNNVAQIVHDLGGQADPRKLARVARACENATVRRLGYLLERFGHKRRAAALLPFARKAKSLKPLHPRVRLVPSLARGIKHPEAAAWKLILNVPVEIDDE
ncbi:MAG: type IV toxin-antitoxin system AbiEi family antitoxin [Vicinamibacterales bacterium]